MLCTICEVEQAMSFDDVCESCDSEFCASSYEDDDFDDDFNDDFPMSLEYDDDDPRDYDLSYMDEGY